ncbi:hypothetical protein ACWC9R_12260 [Streptomyces sp. NPDC001219]
MSVDREEEPRFFVLEYVTITRDPRTQLVVAIGGDERAAGILQTTGGFISAPGPRGPYHRQPHSLPVDQQRAGATAAAHALLLAGVSVHLARRSTPSPPPRETGRPRSATSTRSPNAPMQPSMTARSPRC